MWQMNWLIVDEFMWQFASEQDYVDAMFTQIVLLNFGVWVSTEDALSQT